MDRGAWQATVHSVTESDTIEMTYLTKNKLLWRKLRSDNTGLYVSKVTTKSSQSPVIRIHRDRSYQDCRNEGYISQGNSAFGKFVSWYSDLKIVGINTDLLSFH